MTAVRIAAGVVVAPMVLAAAWTVVVVAIVGWGRRVDVYRWGWRGWRARAARGLHHDKPGVYVQWAWWGLPCYVGQSVNARQRFMSEGKEIMALTFAFGMVLACRADEMNQLETALIRLLPWCRWTRHNLTRGGS